MKALISSLHALGFESTDNCCCYINFMGLSLNFIPCVVCGATIHWRV